MAITIEIAPYISQLEVSTSVTEVTANLAFVSSLGLEMSSENVLVTPYNSITAENLQEALQQLADQSFRSVDIPTGSNLEQGDQWYNPDTQQLYVYREVSPGVVEWVPIMIGNDSPNSDTVDAGAF